VIHVEVGQEDVDAPQLAHLPVDGPDARPGVEDTEAAGLGPHLDA
jgi:hypothetical protein